jgi:hypothetical protein
MIMAKMKTLLSVIKYWPVIVEVFQRLREEQDVLSRVRVNPNIAVGLTNLAIEVAKAKEDHVLLNREKSILMRRYWAVLDSIEVDRPKTVAELMKRASDDG